MTGQPRYYRALVNILIAAGEMATYYGDAGTTPSEALRSATLLALAEHPGKTVAGHRIWPSSD
ncbi:hypothetical protein AB0O91_21895 [Kitasatospora sp. NPDC089797]|uniref:hypothetical protein n=1 Tax=Kitasatospora sp. NPDC089797 TaxID=3155298 RepID=UPI003429EED8